MLFRPPTLSSIHTHTHTHTHTYTFSMIFSIPLFWTVGKSYVSSIILLQFNIILVVSSHQLHPVFSLVDSYTFMTLDKCLYLQALIGATISITPSKRYIFPLSMAQFLSAVIVTVVIRWQHFHHSRLGSAYIDGLCLFSKLTLDSFCYHSQLSV